MNLHRQQDRPLRSSASPSTPSSSWVRRAAPVLTALIATTVAAVPTAAAAPAARPAPAPAASRPILVVPGQVDAGKRMALTAAGAAFGQRCTVAVEAPTGRRTSFALVGVRRAGSSVRLRVRPDARGGTWSLSMRCGATTGPRVSVRVNGRAAARGSVLATEVSVVQFSRRYPSGLSRPAADQDGAGAPQFSPTEFDGVGASTGVRAARALQWALKQVGRTEYRLWCLRFAAHAYNAPTAGYPTAQVAADSLDLQGRGGSPASAPAGALVFFHFSTPDGASYGHVGLSLGDGRMISAQETVKIERISSIPAWRTNYLGWSYAPAAWPGYPPAAPAPSAGTLPDPTPTPTAPSPLDSIALPPPVVTAPPEAEPPAPEPVRRRIITVDNRVTNGLTMVEDPSPAFLQTQPWTFCIRRKCRIDGTNRASGGTWDAAVCQIQGDLTSNGSYADPADDANPDLYQSTLYYGVEQEDGVRGFVSETWIRAADRGGMGLPECPTPAPPASITG